MILVIGECVLDVVEQADGTTAAHPGGSPANVAVGLARLGQDVTLLTELGDDAAGESIGAHLAQAGVTTLRAASSTTTPQARARLRADGSADYEFDIAWTLSADADAGLDSPAHVHTGSIASHILPGADAVEAILAARQSGATVSYDPNVRPSLVGDHAEVVARTEHLVALSDLVKASDEDLAWLYPDVPPGEVLMRWSETGPALAVATLGAHGLLVCLRGTLLEVPAVAVEVADTVGAGDSSMSALIDGLLRERLLGEGGRERLRTATTGTVLAVAERAARAAALTVSRPGANPPSLAELDGTGRD